MQITQGGPRWILPALTCGRARGRRPRRVKGSIENIIHKLMQVRVISADAGLARKCERGLNQDSKHMARILNNNFVSVFTVETIPEGPEPPRGITPLEVDSICDQEVKKYLDNLDTNKSTGHDNLSPRLLKELRQQILQPLTNI